MASNTHTLSGHSIPGPPTGPAPADSQARRELRAEEYKAEHGHFPGWYTLGDFNGAIETLHGGTVVKSGIDNAGQKREVERRKKEILASEDGRRQFPRLAAKSVQGSMKASLQGGTQLRASMLPYSSGKLEGGDFGQGAAQSHHEGMGRDSGSLRDTGEPRNTGEFHPDEPQQLRNGMVYYPGTSSNQGAPQNTSSTGDYRQSASQTYTSTPQPSAVESHVEPAPKVPEGWHALVDARSGHYYYYNTTTRQTQWEFPYEQG